MKSVLRVVISILLITPFAASAQDIPAPPPLISGVTDITVFTDESSGTTVSFSLTASAGITAVPVTCSPESGSLFPVGTTTVTCSASNDAFATSTKTFDVGVVLQEASTTDTT